MYNKQKQIGSIVAQLQSENRVFDNMIIALERLEGLLNAERNVQSLQQTAMDSERDIHDDSLGSRDRETYFLEPSLHCTTLYMTAGYEDPEVFSIASESFLKDLMEWYAGRELLEYYDEVDACVVPIVAALARSSEMMTALDCESVFDVYQKYVMEVSLEKKSSDDGYNQAKEGVEAWILGQHYAGKPMEFPEGYVLSHKRGDVQDGYKRIITALTVLFESSAPAKMFYKIINQHLPEVAQQYPDINEDGIDKLYQRKSQGFPEEEKRKLFPSVNSDIYPMLDRAVKDVLEKHGVDFSRVDITINITVNK